MKPKGDLHTALEIMVRLKERAGTYMSTGICNALRPADLDTLYLYELFRGWDEFSGSVTHPVPGPLGMSAKEAFIHLSKWEGEYGAARLRLLDYLIEKVTEDLDRET